MGFVMRGEGILTSAEEGRSTVYVSAQVVGRREFVSIDLTTLNTSRNKIYLFLPTPTMSRRPDIHHLRLAVKLAEEALLAGDDPFGSVLVDDATGRVLAQDRNRTKTGRDGDGVPDATLHPEIELARWAERHLSPAARAATTVYTSGEHCPMCAAAHAHCGLGRIVYVSSSAQYRAWREEFGAPAGRVAALAIGDVVPGLVVEGPVEGLDEEVKALQRRRLTEGK